MSEFDDRLNALLSDPDSMAQIVQLAQQLSGQQAPPPEPSPADPPESSFDPSLFQKAIPLLQEFSREKCQSAQLLRALRPYLRAEKQEKVAQAIQMAHLITLAKRFLAEGDNGHV